MKKVVTVFFKYPLQFLILFAFTQMGCYKTPIQFGQGYVNTNFSNLVLVDTLSVQLTTVYSDSVATSGSGAALAGNYNDKTFGKIVTKSFFEVAPPAISELATNSVFDSVKLIAIPNKSYYGDTTFSTQLSVFQLTNQMTFPLYQTSFYNNTNFSVDPTPLGSINTQIFPNITDTVFIPLSNAKGQELFDLYKSNDFVMQSTNNFLAYFKGLQIAPTNGNMHAVYGFKDSMRIRLYYHQTDVFITNKYLDFTFYNNDNTQFIQVKSDRTGTPVDIFNSTNKEVASAATNNSVYLQYLTGFLPKIKFPTLRSLLLRPDYTKILRADLIVKPVKYTYNSITPLPPQLLAVTTNVNNTFGPALTNGAGGYQTGNLVIDQLYNENTMYDYDVTSYLQLQILVTATNQNGLLLVPPSTAWISTLNSAVIGDQKNTQGSIQLKLYYVSVNP